MPCYDGREKQDARDKEIKVDALTALLCGVMNNKPELVSAATAWCAIHNELDRLKDGRRWVYETAIVEKMRPLNERSDMLLSAVYREHCAFNPAYDDGEIKSL